MTNDLRQRVAEAMESKRQELIAQPLARIWPELADAAITAMSEWQPIETAPKNTVILTEAGTATWTPFNGWCLSTDDGTVPRCADWGCEVSQISPTIWMPLPLPPHPEGE